MFLVWAVLVGLTRLVSLGSIVGAIVAPLIMYVWGEPMPVVVLGVIAAILVVVRHKDNIVRLIQGKELKVQRITKE